MQKYLILTISFVLALFVSCNKKAEINALVSSDFYMIFTIDGKEVNIPAEEVSTTYNTALKKPVFKIMAGEYGKINLNLITTESVTKPSSTPSGSIDFDDQIKQGSVSLQNYPEKNYTSNSYNMGTPNSMVISPNAISITKSTRVGDTHRIIEGTFNAKVFGGDPGTDKNVSDHVVVGKFRLKHEFTDVKF
jgi:hypothetical protein